MAVLNLAPREKRLIGSMLLVMVSLVTLLMYQKTSKALVKSENLLSQAEGHLSAATLYRETIISEREGQKVIQVKLKARSRTFDLYNFSNKCISELKLKDRASLQSVGLASKDKAFEGVRITLKNINMEELKDLLLKMYGSNNLIMMKKMAYLRPARDGNGLEFYCKSFGFSNI